MTRRPIPLTIAGSDSGAGAGIQADLKTFAAHGVYGASVITAVTAQNTSRVDAVHLVPADIVLKQIDAVFEDFDVAAVKIGMLGSAEIADVVAAALRRFAPPFVVLDPVLAASTGGALAREGLAAAIMKDLSPIIDCLTPNLGEAGALLGAAPAKDEREMSQQGRALVERGARAVLIKGGHLEGEAVDLLVTPTETHRFAAPRIETRNNHGTGCTLSSAIAAAIVQGRGLVAAVAEAKAFTRQALLAGRAEKIGRGAGPLVQIAMK